jgi:TonB family protein
MKKVLLAVLLISAVGAVAQNTQGRKVKSGFGVSVVQKQPQFAGGTDSLNSFLQKNINYPLQARLDNIQGRVYIGFSITETGKVVDVRILSGMNEELDNEALRVANTFPDWIPGTVDGKPVKTHYVLPIDFVIPAL